MVTAATTTASIAGTMSIESDRGRWLRWGLAAAGLLVGSLLVVSAVPRIAAYWLVLPAGASLDAIDEGRVISRENAEAAFRSYSEALAWQPEDPTLREDRARLASRLARLDPESADRWKELAVEDFRQTVALSPGNGTAWARLAEAELEAGAPVEKVLPYLRLARLTAPRRASALLPQLSIVMRHWEAMPDEMRAHALADLTSFWTRRAIRPLLVSIYLDAGFEARAAFRERLGENERALRDFDRLIASSLDG